MTTIIRLIQVDDVVEVLYGDQPDERPWRIRLRLKSGQIFPAAGAYLRMSQLDAHLQNFVRERRFVRPGLNQGSWEDVGLI